MHRLRGAIIAVLGVFASFSVVFCSGAEARVVMQGKYDAWTLAAMIGDEDSKFVGCAAAAEYEEGTRLFFVLTSNYKWTMWLENASWALNKGTKLNLAFSIDSGYAQPLNGLVATDKMVAFLLADSEAVFNQFRYGSILTIRVMGSRYPFTLKGSNVALTGALRCVQKHNNEMTGPNPFAIASGNANGGAMNASLRAEAVTIIANLLSQSLRGGQFRILNDDERASLAPRADAAWISAGVAGALNIVTSPNIDYDTLAANIVASDSKACQGKFASTKTPKVENKVTVIELSTYCIDAKGSSETRYLATPRPKGGLYVYTMTSIPVAEEESTTVEALTASLKGGSRR